MLFPSGCKPRPPADEIASRKIDLLMRLDVNKILAVLILTAVPLATAHAQSSSAQSAVVVRTTKAMHYRPGGTSKVAFQGTDLMQRGSGEARVEAKKSNIQID